MEWDAAVGQQGVEWVAVGQQGVEGAAAMGLQGMERTTFGQQGVERAVAVGQQGVERAAAVGQRGVEGAAVGQQGVEGSDHDVEHQGVAVEHQWVPEGDVGRQLSDQWSWSMQNARDVVTRRQVEQHVVVEPQVVRENGTVGTNNAGAAVVEQGVLGQRQGELLEETENAEVQQQQGTQRAESGAGVACTLAERLVGVVEHWPLRQQRAWAARVNKGDARIVKRKACSILRDWVAEEGCLGWSIGLGRPQQPVADVEVHIGSPRQWFKSVVRRVDAAVAQVDAATARDWALTVVEGEASLAWSQQGVSGYALVQVVPWSSDSEGLRFPERWLGGWRDPVLARPEVQEDGALVWEATLQHAPELDDAEVQRWWGEKADVALRECLDCDCEELGGFFEKEECAPDERVLGAWVQKALLESVRGLEATACDETTHEQNPAWAAGRHAQQVFQAGQLHEYVEAWRQAGADTEVLDWLVNGYHIHVGVPRLESGKEPDGWKGIRKRNGGVACANVDDFRVVVLEVLRKRAWEVVVEKEVWNRLPMNLAPKPGKLPPWRLILNCMELNEFVALWSVRYETLKTVPLVVDQGDWIFSIDFTDAYYQLLLDAVSQRLVGAGLELTQEQVQALANEGLLPEGFEWDHGAEYVDVRVRPRGLPMGFKNSCAVWTKVARVLTTLWRRKGFKLVHLLDDLLFSVSGTFEEACVVRDEVLADLDRLGVMVNWKKSVLHPSRCLRFLGMLVNSEVYRFFVPPDKVEKLRELVLRMAGEPVATVRAIASVVGKIMSMQVAVPAVRMVSAGLYALVRPDGDWDRSQEVTEELVSELCGAVKWVQQWAKFGNPIRRHVGMTGVRIFVDAGTGYGWRIDGHDRTAEFEGSVLARAEDWPEGQAEMWQPWKELWALRYCLEEEGERLAGSVVLVQPDATTTVAYVNKGSGPSMELSLVMRSIWDVCIKHCISLTAEHFAGDRMIGTGVDSLSRMAEFSVAQSLFRILNREWGFGCRGKARGYTMDLYASAKTTKCERYAAKGGPLGSVGDARLIELGAEENFWVVPPLNCLAQVVMTVLGAGSTATLVVPDWPDQPWHVRLRRSCAGFRFLRWHETKPVMWDVSVKSRSHVHLVDKWDFVAFAVGGAEQRAPVELWRQRRDKAKTGSASARPSRGLWSLKAERREARTRGPGATKQGADRVRGVLRGPVGKRVLRVLSLCNGCGAFSLALEKLKVTAEIEVVVVESDEDCLAFTQWRFPHEPVGWSCDVRDWAGPGFKPKQGEEEFWFDLVVAGFPCQDLSEANGSGGGLQGRKSALFFDIWGVVQKLRVVNPGLHWVLECVHFESKFPRDFALVEHVVGVPPVVLCASRLAPAWRRRAWWNSFEVEELPFDPGANPESVLGVGRWTDKEKLPTVVASGIQSWSTREVVFDEALGGVAAGRQPLTTVEMERCLGMHDGFTAMPGLSHRTRHHMIGNSFHVGVVQHIIRAWIVLLKEFDSTLGFPGEGPTWEQKRRRLESVESRSVKRRDKEKSRLGHHGVLQGAHPRVPVGETAPVVVYSKAERKAQAVFGGSGAAAEAPSSSTVVKGSGRQEALWKGALPVQPQQCKGLSLSGVFRDFEWGGTERALLPARAPKQRFKVPVGQGFQETVNLMVRDLVLCSRSDATWLAYRTWLSVFEAFLEKFGVGVQPNEDNWDHWLEVLVVAVAVLAQSYSLGTMGVFVSAVAARLHDSELRSPWESRLFAMIMKGLPRYLGVGKAKKPPVEAWHIALIVRMPRPKAFTIMQHLQALAVLVVGWHLFTRSQDFVEFQACDFVQLLEGMRVFVRYAKNDQKGLTRTPLLAAAAKEEACPVKIYRAYVATAGIRVHPGCTKVEGEPDRCTVCPPAFPSIGKHKGKMDRAMPKSRVTELLRVFFLELAAAGHMTEGEARAFSSKSLRTGGVTAAAGACIRDGVVQGHGGWLHRQSLVHYDQMREGERNDVSLALGKAVGAWLN